MTPLFRTAILLVYALLSGETSQYSTSDNFFFSNI